MSKKILFASDYRGIEARQYLVENIKNPEFEIEDMGIFEGSCLDYVDISRKLADRLAETPSSFGVMICGTGQGVAIALNRYSHVRAVVCRTEDDVLQARSKLDANVLCIGSKNTENRDAMALVRKFAETGFIASKHEPCVRKLETRQTGHG